ncbi:cytochrome P450 [Aspergillus undulatus]|uniref:cytochrome P450 n=1 Tax=Aspergillus undulatus TaxID=1810928 RepID=UPI003CCDC6D7
MEFAVLVSIHRLIVFLKLVLHSLALLLCYAAIHLIRVYWALLHIPGPFWARFTNLQRVSWVTNGRAHEIQQSMHKKYGEVVRFGPNMVSLSIPAGIPIVYPTRMGVPKAPWTKNGALPAVFSSRDEKVHKSLRSPIAGLYSTSKVLSLEVFIDRTLDVVTEQIDKRFVKSQETFDLASWLQYFAYGFLEQEKDVGGMLNAVWTFLKGAAPFTQIPWLDEVWNKNAIVTMFQGATGLSLMGIVAKFVAKRQEAQRVGPTEDGGNGDMLSSFMEIQANHSLPPWFINAWTFSNITAGSDSVAVVMRTNELVQADKANAFNKPYPSWKDVCDLPYLDTCNLEALRVHLPFCLPFERIVARGGMMIGGDYFAEGTVIGLNPYVVNRHKPTFGEDTGLWNPDRWMVPKELKAKREAAVLTFGAGRRLKKIVPALVLHYDVNSQSRTTGFFRQYGMDVTVKKRAA